MIMLELGTITKQQSEFVKSLNFYGEKIDEFEARFKVLESMNKRINECELKLRTFETNCSEVSKRMNDLQQQLKANEVDIVGIPERKNENILEVVRNISTALGLPSAVNDVNNCFRCHFSTKNDKPRPISVAFRSKMIKAEFVNAYKRKKGLSAVEVGFTEPDTSIFINDALTAYNRKLFYMAKQFCKTKEFKYCWIQDSRILIRQNDRSKILRISSEEDLAVIG